MKNKLYVTVILVFVLTILVTVYSTIQFSQKNKNNEEEQEVISLSNGWVENRVTDYKLTIHGSYYLSTDLDSDITHDYYCETPDCEFITGNDNYALIRDNGYLIFSLFDNGVYYLSDFEYELDEIQFLINNGTLYGNIYRNGNNDFYYSLDTNDYYFVNDNIEIDANSKYVIDKNELIIKEDDHYSLVNYLTMEQLIVASNLELNYYEKENDYLILASDYIGDIINVYTSSLKSVNIPSIRKVGLSNNHVILTDFSNKFFVKNFNNETIMISEEYDDIYDIIRGLVIAKRDDKLLIINSSCEVLKEIDLNGMEYDHIRSGYNNESIDYEEGLYLYIGNDLNYQEIYFNPETLESYQKDV